MPKKVETIDEIGTVEFVKRIGQRSLRVTIKPGKTVVSMPHYTPLIVARRFVLSKKDWITQHSIKDSKYEDGMHIGKSHRLVIDSRRSNTTVKNLTIYGNHDEASVKKGILRALLAESESLLPKRIQALAQDVTPKHIKFRHMKGRWGSCSSDGILTFNILLVQLPWEQIDYVIIHELSHMRHMNHSKEFWSEVESKCPNYKQTRKELRKYNPVIYNTAYGSAIA